jgi:hypothetical protein
MNIHLLLIQTSHFVNVQDSSLEHIRERLAGFIIIEVIN